MDEKFEKLIEQAAAELPPETYDEAIWALAEGFQIPPAEMAQILAEELGATGETSQ